MNDIAVDTSPKSVFDWTTSYSSWESYFKKQDDLETTAPDATAAATNEKVNPFMGHCNDHGEERRMFEMSEPDKMIFCEEKRIMVKKK